MDPDRLRQLAADIDEVIDYIDTDEDYPNRCLGGAASIIREIADGTWTRLEDRA